MIDPALGLGLAREILFDLRNTLGVEALRRELQGRPDLWGLLTQLAQSATVPVPPASNLRPFSTSGNWFMKDGQRFLFTGYNIRAAAYFGEPMDETRWGDMAFLEHEIRVAKDLGGKVLRFYAAHVNYTVEQSIPRVIAVLDLLERYGMYAIIPLTDGVHSGFGIKDTEQNFRGRHTHEFYSGGYGQHYLPYVRKMVEAVKDHPALFMLEIGNEFLVPFPPFVPNAPTLKQYENILNFFKVAADTIREAAPHNLIGTGLVSAWELFADQAFGGQQFAKQLYAHPTIDAASVHTYQSRTNAHEWGEAGFNLEREMALEGHPLYIGETGMQWDTQDGGWSARLGIETSHRVSGLCPWALHAWHAPRAGGDAQVGMNQHQSAMWHHAVGNMRHLAQNVFR